MGIQRTHFDSSVFNKLNLQEHVPLSLYAPPTFVLNEVFKMHIQMNSLGFSVLHRSYI